VRILLALLVSSLLSAPSLTAQAGGSGSARPEAAAADVHSLDAIIGALYDVISGPAGPRDWDRFRSLFKDGARLIPTFGQDGNIGMRVSTPEEYAERAGPYFSNNGFFEREIGRTVEEYGQLVHAFSAYDSRRTAEGEPFVRGINSIQLLNDGTRWWVVSIMWADVTTAGEIPARYLRGH